MKQYSVASHVVTWRWFAPSTSWVAMSIGVRSIAHQPSSTKPSALRRGRYAASQPPRAMAFTITNRDPAAGWSYIQDPNSQRPSRHRVGSLRLTFARKSLFFNVESNTCNLLPPIRHRVARRLVTFSFRYSFFPDESEIILSPNARFFVSKEVSLQVHDVDSCKRSCFV